jgi:hypothetical protein
VGGAPRPRVPNDLACLGPRELALGVRARNGQYSVNGILHVSCTDPFYSRKSSSSVLASVHKCLRLCDLCKELASGAATRQVKVPIFIQVVRIQRVAPPVPGESVVAPDERESQSDGSSFFGLFTRAEIF